MKGKTYEDLRKNPNDDKENKIERGLINSYIRNLFMQEGIEGGFGVDRKNAENEGRIFPIHGSDVRTDMHFSEPYDAATRWVIAYEMLGWGKDRSTREILDRVQVSEDSIRVSPVNPLSKFRGPVKVAYSSTEFFAKPLGDLLGIRLGKTEGDGFTQRYSDYIRQEDREVFDGSYREVIKAHGEITSHDGAIILLPLAKYHIPVVLRDTVELFGRETYFIEADGSVSKADAAGERAPTDMTDKDLAKRVEDGEKIVVVFSPAKLTSYTFRVEAKSNARYLMFTDRETTASDFWQAKRRDRNDLGITVIYNGELEGTTAAEKKTSFIKGLGEREDLTINEALVRAWTESHNEAMVSRFEKLTDLIGRDKVNAMRKYFQSRQKPDYSTEPKEESNVYQQILGGITKDIRDFAETVAEFSRGKTVKVNGKDEYIKLSTEEKRFFEQYLAADENFRKASSARFEGNNPDLVNAAAKVIGIPSLEASQIREMLGSRYTAEELENMKVSSSRPLDATYIVRDIVKSFAAETSTKQDLARKIDVRLTEKGYARTEIAEIIKQMAVYGTEQNGIQKAASFARWTGSVIRNIGPAFMAYDKDDKENSDPRSLIKSMPRLQYTINQAKAMAYINSFNGALDVDKFNVLKNEILPAYDKANAQFNYNDLRAAVIATLAKSIDKEAAELDSKLQKLATTRQSIYEQYKAEQKINPYLSLSEFMYHQYMSGAFQDKSIDQSLSTINYLEQWKARLLVGDEDVLRVVSLLSRHYQAHEAEEVNSRTWEDISKYFGQTEGQRVKNNYDTARDTILETFKVKAALLTLMDLVEGALSQKKAEIEQLAVENKDANVVPVLIAKSLERSADIFLAKERKRLAKDEQDIILVPVFYDDSIETQIQKTFAHFTMAQSGWGLHTQHYPTELMMNLLIKDLQKEYFNGDKHHPSVVYTRMPLFSSEGNTITDLIGEGKDFTGALITIHPFTSSLFGTLIKPFSVAFPRVNAFFMRKAFNHEFGHVMGLSHGDGVMASSTKIVGSLFPWKWHFVLKGMYWNLAQNDEVKRNQYKAFNNQEGVITHVWDVQTNEIEETMMPMTEVAEAVTGINSEASWEDSFRNWQREFNTMSLLQGNPIPEFMQWYPYAGRILLVRNADGYIGYTVLAVNAKAKKAINAYQTVKEQSEGQGIETDMMDVALNDIARPMGVKKVAEFRNKSNLEFAKKIVKKLPAVAMRYKRTEEKRERYEITYYLRTPGRVWATLLNAPGAIAARFDPVLIRWGKKVHTAAANAVAAVKSVMPKAAEPVAMPTAVHGNAEVTNLISDPEFIKAQSEVEVEVPAEVAPIVPSFDVQLPRSIMGDAAIVNIVSQPDLLDNELLQNSAVTEMAKLIGRDSITVAREVAAQMNGNGNGDAKVAPLNIIAAVANSLNSGDVKVYIQTRKGNKNAIQKVVVTNGDNNRAVIIRKNQQYYYATYREGIDAKSITRSRMVKVQAGDWDERLSDILIGAAHGNGNGDKAQVTPSEAAVRPVSGDTQAVSETAASVSQDNKDGGITARLIGRIMPLLGGLRNTVSGSDAIVTQHNLMLSPDAMGPPSWKAITFAIRTIVVGFVRSANARLNGFIQVIINKIRAVGAVIRMLGRAWSIVRQVYARLPKKFDGSIDIRLTVERIYNLIKPKSLTVAGVAQGLTAVNELSNSGGLPSTTELEGSNEGRDLPWSSTGEISTSSTWSVLPRTRRSLRLAGKAQAGTSGSSSSMSAPETSSTARTLVPMPGKSSMAQQGPTSSITSTAPDTGASFPASVPGAAQASGVREGVQPAPEGINRNLGIKVTASRAAIPQASGFMLFGSVFAILHNLALSVAGRGPPAAWLFISGILVITAFVFVYRYQSFRIDGVRRFVANLIHKFGVVARFVLSVKRISGLSLGSLSTVAVGSTIGAAHGILEPLALPLSGSNPGETPVRALWGRLQSSAVAGGTRLVLGATEIREKALPKAESLLHHKKDLGFGPANEITLPWLGGVLIALGTLYYFGFGPVDLITSPWLVGVIHGAEAFLNPGSGIAVLITSPWLVGVISFAGALLNIGTEAFVTLQGGISTVAGVIGLAANFVDNEALMTAVGAHTSGQLTLPMVAGGLIATIIAGGVTCLGPITKKVSDWITSLSLNGIVRYSQQPASRKPGAFVSFLLTSVRVMFTRATAAPSSGRSFTEKAAARLSTGYTQPVTTATSLFTTSGLPSALNLEQQVLESSVADGGLAAFVNGASDRKPTTSGQLTLSDGGSMTISRGLADGGTVIDLSVAASLFEQAIQAAQTLNTPEWLVIVSLLSVPAALALAFKFHLNPIKVIAVMVFVEMLAALGYMAMTMPSALPANINALWTKISALSPFVLGSVVKNQTTLGDFIAGPPSFKIEVSPRWKTYKGLRGREYADQTFWAEFEIKDARGKSLAEIKACPCEKAAIGMPSDRSEVYHYNLFKEHYDYDGIILIRVKPQAFKTQEELKDFKEQLLALDLFASVYVPEKFSSVVKKESDHVYGWLKKEKRIKYVIDGKFVSIEQGEMVESAYPKATKSADKADVYLLLYLYQLRRQYLARSDDFVDIAWEEIVKRDRWQNETMQVPSHMLKYVGLTSTYKALFLSWLLDNKAKRLEAAVSLKEESGVHRDGGDIIILGQNISERWQQRVASGELKTSLAQKDASGEAWLLELGVQSGANGEPEFYGLRKDAQGNVVRKLDGRVEEKTLDNGFVIQLNTYRGLRPGATDKKAVGRLNDLAAHDASTCPFGCTDETKAGSLRNLVDHKPLGEFMVNGTLWRAYKQLAPLDARGHFLLVPDVFSEEQIRQQRLIAKDIEDMVAIAGASHNVLIIFNSRRAGASVNHIHFQGLYRPEPCPVESAAREVVHQAGSLTVSRLAKEYPARGLSFDSPEADVLAASLWETVDSLQKADVPFNLVFGDGKVYVFARNAEHGIVEEFPTGVLAAVEVAGKIIVVDENTYQNVTAERVKSGLAKTTMDIDVHQRLGVVIKKENNTISLSAEGEHNVEEFLNIMNSPKLLAKLQKVIGPEIEKLRNAGDVNREVFIPFSAILAVKDGGEQRSDRLMSLAKQVLPAVASFAILAGSVYFLPASPLLSVILAVATGALATAVFAAKKKLSFTNFISFLKQPEKISPAAMLTISLLYQYLNTYRGAGATGSQAKGPKFKDMMKKYAPWQFSLKENFSRKNLVTNVITAALFGAAAVVVLPQIAPALGLVVGFLFIYLVFVTNNFFFIYMQSNIGFGNFVKDYLDFQAGKMGKTDPAYAMFEESAKSFDAAAVQKSHEEALEESSFKQLKALELKLRAYAPVVWGAVRFAAGRGALAVISLIAAAVLLHSGVGAVAIIPGLSELIAQIFGLSLSFTWADAIRIFLVAQGISLLNIKDIYDRVQDKFNASNASYQKARSEFGAFVLNTENLKLIGEGAIKSSDLTADELSHLSELSERGPPQGALTTTLVYWLTQAPAAVVYWFGYSWKNEKDRPSSLWLDLGRDFGKSYFSLWIINLEIGAVVQVGEALSANPQTGFFGEMAGKVIGSLEGDRADQRGSALHWGYDILSLLGIKTSPAVTTNRTVTTDLNINTTQNTTVKEAPVVRQNVIVENPALAIEVGIKEGALTPDKPFGHRVNLSVWYTDNTSRMVQLPANFDWDTMDFDQSEFVGAYTYRAVSKNGLVADIDVNNSRMFKAVDTAGLNASRGIASARIYSDDGENAVIEVRYKNTLKAPGVNSFGNFDSNISFDQIAAASLEEVKLPDNTTQVDWVVTAKESDNHTSVFRAPFVFAAVVEPFTNLVSGDNTTAVPQSVRDYTLQNVQAENIVNFTRGGTIKQD
ncbi:MAG: hypothetical protein PHT59_02505, partial [Candidatus Omnitrophica bacterium]|nr:hypothetical protein [Candidatus Omnitrophota bacterium]